MRVWADLQDSIAVMFLYSSYCLPLAFAHTCVLFELVSLYTCIKDVAGYWGIEEFCSIGVNYTSKIAFESMPMAGKCFHTHLYRDCLNHVCLSNVFVWECCCGRHTRYIHGTQQEIWAIRKQSMCFPIVLTIVIENDVKLLAHSDCMFVTMGWGWVSFKLFGSLGGPIRSSSVHSSAICKNQIR